MRYIIVNDDSKDFRIIKMILVILKYLKIAERQIEKLNPLDME